jgi:hypothetical protein
MNAEPQKLTQDSTLDEQIAYARKHFGQEGKDWVVTYNDAGHGYVCTDPKHPLLWKRDAQRPCPALGTQSR